jgi:squalene-hopene/tetraprenyl-beta-curcumene cyclase
MPFDHDCPYVTGHAISALAATGQLSAQPQLLRKALTYLTRSQRPDGTFASIWFRESVAGTASVLEALCDADIPDHPIARRAFEALMRGQSEDGGWAGVRGQRSTVEETAWALLALLATGRAPAASINAGVNWLLEHQRSDGTWEPAPIGLYYSAMWYSDSMYALALPMQALARAAHSATPARG